MNIEALHYQQKIEEAVKDNKVLRRILWEQHPCEGKYGDDGELQCNLFIAPIDFKRDSVAEIERKCIIHNLQRTGQVIPKDVF